MHTKRRSNKNKWISISILSVVAVATVATLLMRPAPDLYESVTAKTGDITTYYSFSGNVETKNRQNVMSGKIIQVSEILVKEGDKVKEGDVLIKTTTADEIKSKINGEIAKIHVEENAQAMTGVILIEIVDYENLQINVKVDEYDIAALAKDKETTVKIGAINKEIKGKIRSISKEGQVINGVTFFIATIDLEKDSQLKIGMSAEVKLLSDQSTGVITLPMSAIQFEDNNQPYVLKKDEKGQPLKTEIQTGLNDGTNVEIKSGVENGEEILYGKISAGKDSVFPPNPGNQSSASINQDSNSGGGEDK